MNKRQMKKAVKKVISLYVQGKINHSCMHGAGVGRAIVQNSKGETALVDYGRGGDSYQQIGRNVKAVGMLFPATK